MGNCHGSFFQDNLVLCLTSHKPINTDISKYRDVHLFRKYFTNIERDCLVQGGWVWPIRVAFSSRSSGSDFQGDLGTLGNGTLMVWDRAARLPSPWQ